MGPAAAAPTAVPPAGRSAAVPFLVGAVTTRLTVTVPSGISGGELVRVAAPDGSYHSVMVPAGLSAGQQFSVELLANPSDGCTGEMHKLRVELEAERHLRRETQQEAIRTRQALEALAQKRRADHALLHEMLRRQRRCIDHLTAQLGAA
mmetsp:Transcript_33820/g.99538  ORF Transcript_33820/g.99538 Transcript_33820/m.99538 type:complete len:149 (+) Transcript_33820:2-448(+)